MPWHRTKVLRTISDKALTRILACWALAYLGVASSSLTPAEEEGWALDEASLDPLEVNLLHTKRIVQAAAPDPLAPPRKPVIWVHLHKNAGSTMCVWARTRAKERCVKPWSNCNSLQLGDDWIRNGLAARRSWTSCKERAALFRQGNFTWGQIERELSEGDVCLEDFIYGIMLRDPVRRLESYVNGNTVPKYRTWLHCVETADEAACPKPGGLRVSGQGHENFDNFLVRTLGGYDVMRLPPGAVNATHAEAALALLKRFDLVAVLEQLDTEATRAAMDRVLGWHPEGTPQGVYKQKYKWNRVTFSADDVERLTKVNRFDYQLYDHFATPEVVPVHEHSRQSSSFLQRK